MMTYQSELLTLNNQQPHLPTLYFLYSDKIAPRNGLYDDRAHAHTDE